MNNPESALFKLLDLLYNHLGSCSQCIGIPWLQLCPFQAEPPGRRYWVARVACQGLPTFSQLEWLWISMLCGNIQCLLATKHPFTILKTSHCESLSGGSANNPMGQHPSLQNGSLYHHFLSKEEVILVQGEKSKPVLYNKSNHFGLKGFWTRWG